MEADGLFDVATNTALLQYQNYPATGVSFPNQGHKKGPKTDRKPGKCHYCGKEGHWKPECSGRTPLGRLSSSLCPYTVTPCNGSSSYKCSALAPDDKGTTPSSYVTDWRNKRSSDDDFPPPEHRLKSKIAKFWECLFPQFGLTQVWNQLEVTHYRLATFANATRAALQGVKDELTALRLTTVHRMALDLLLTKEGGVCAMVGDSCCTYIPANDEDHGAISVALDRMQQVSTQLQLDEHGGCLMERVYALASSLNPQRSEYVVMSRTGPSAIHPTGTPP
ncbi:hypothetical protein MHYP_G00363610 [Metynnis hypsauchen]